MRYDKGKVGVPLRRGILIVEYGVGVLYQGLGLSPFDQRNEFQTMFSQVLLLGPGSRVCARVKACGWLSIRARVNVERTALYFLAV